MKEENLVFFDRLLIADIDKKRRAAISEIFKFQYNCIEAEGGREAIGKLRENQNKICAVLMGTELSDMSSTDALRQMQNEGFTERIPFFIMDSGHDSKAITAAYNLGITDKLTEPFTQYEVERRVNSAIELFWARDTLGIITKNQRLMLNRQSKRIEFLLIEIMESLATAIEFRDSESGDHVQRIRDISYTIMADTQWGKGMSPDEISHVSIAAVMHDVGKIAISDTILNKPGRFTPEEFEVMKTHTNKGYALLSQLLKIDKNPMYLAACDIALHHHERWDGRGYPSGLKGNEISRNAQLVSIADVYDALVTKRVYKDPIHYDRAVKMILEGECGVFNPELLECFLSVESKLRKFYQ